MSFSKWYKKPLQPGDKFVTIGEWNPHWMGVLEYVNHDEVRMIKPSKPDSYVKVGYIGYCNYTKLEHENIFWIRYNDKPKKSYHPDWF